MNRRWAVNASPLILLGKIGKLEILSRLASELVIPAGVAEEVEQGEEDDPARRWLREAGASHIVRADEIDPLVGSWDLGLGETQVLSWAHRNARYEAIVDDGAARKCAEALKIPLRGTLSVILVAKREGIVPLARPLLSQLVDIGYRIAPAIVEDALRLAGE